MSIADGYTSRLRAQRAIDESIRKWQAIVDGTGGDKGARNCKLCKEYQSFEKIHPCSGCPVYAYTGAQFCYRTPYVEWQQIMNDPLTFQEGEWVEEYKIPPAGYANREKALAAARAEIAFLKRVFLEV